MSNIRAIYIDEPEKRESRSSDPNIRAMYLDEPAEEKEPLSQSLFYAVPRMASDLKEGIYKTITKLPEYYEKAKTEIPGLADSLIDHPAHVGKQFLAGMAEMGQGTFNAPHDIANYTSNRLHLLSPEINKKIQMSRMPDSEKEINATLGTPEYPGEDLARGTGRNLNLATGLAGLAHIANPMRLTAKSIAKDLVNTESKMKAKYSGPNGKYEKLADKAISRGVTQQHVNPAMIDMQTIEKYTSPKHTDALNDYLNNKNLKTAQTAISDLGYIKRRLENKTTLLQPEKDQLKAVKDASAYIQENMFKDSNGKVHKDLLNEHKEIQKGYATENIPYTKNQALQKYKKGKKLADELVPALSKGEFAATRGKFHPRMGVRKFMAKNKWGVGAGSAYLGKKIYDYLAGADHE